MTISRTWIKGVAPLDEATAVRCIEAPARRPRVDLTITPSNDAWAMAEGRFHKRPRIERVFAWDISDGMLFPPYMILATADGRIALQSIRKRRLLNSLRGYSGWSAEEVEQFVKGRTPEVGGAAPPADLPAIDAPCVVLGSAQGFAYFHWLTELLPKLDLVREDMAAGRRLVVPSLRSPFHTESLRYFGIDPAACLVLERPARFRDLRFLSAIATAPTQLSSFIGAFFSRHEGRGSRRLYVSRTDATRRRVVNESALGCLSDLGFQHVVASALSFAEQAEAFQNADIAVGPHGAGLANTAFMRPGGHVVELLPDSFADGVTCYAALSEERGLTHTIILCPSLGEGSNADFEVRPNELEKLLGTIIHRDRVTSTMHAS